MFSRLTERPKAGAAQSLLDLEPVLAVWVDVLVAGRGEPGDVLLIHRPAFGSKLVDHGGHVDRVPGHHSPTDGIDTTTPAGRFFFHVMASLAQMKRELLAERTRAGPAAVALP